MLDKLYLPKDSKLLIRETLIARKNKFRVRQVLITTIVYTNVLWVRLHWCVRDLCCKPIKHHEIFWDHSSKHCWIVRLDLISAQLLLRRLISRAMNFWERFIIF